MSRTGRGRPQVLCAGTPVLFRFPDVLFRFLDVKEDT